MRRRLLLRFYAVTSSWRFLVSEELLALILVLVVFAVPVSASTRFEQRGLYINSARPGDTTFYKVSLRYMTPLPVGSLDMLFCVSPIPYDPCVAPAGLNVSGATLSDQTGETGFSLLPQSVNHMIITRSPTMINPGAPSSYTFNNIVNPTDTTKSFSIRLSSHASIDATGPHIDFGSVKSQVTESIVLETQVPPMLIFCLAQEVELGCAETNKVYFSDMGDLDETATLSTESQMAAGTNATAGFVITANGDLPAAGTATIAGLDTPTLSQAGINQFGINLVANTFPEVGLNPEGTWANAVPTSGYATPDLYKFVSGDVVASSTSVSLMKKFTVSYILNADKGLKAGVYTTTITFIASGRF